MTPEHTPWWMLRAATPADAAVIATHRAAIFLEIGALLADGRTAFEAAARDWLALALASGEYVGWVLAPRGAPDTIVAGAGVQLRRQIPRPSADRTGVLTDPEGLVLNVWTEPAWRRRGAGEALMRHIIGWAQAEGLGSLVLHASEQGRPLYAKLGFAPTNEMHLGSVLL